MLYGVHLHHAGDRSVELQVTEKDGFDPLNLDVGTQISAPSIQEAQPWTFPIHGENERDMVD
jgi:hypothetical protein